MYNLLTHFRWADIRDHWRSAVRDLEQEAYLCGPASDYGDERWYHRWPRIGAAWEVARIRVTATICDLVGHKIEMDEGGPDNPYVDASCKRCGYSWPRQYW